MEIKERLQKYWVFQEIPFIELWPNTMNLARNKIEAGGQVPCFMLSETRYLSLGVKVLGVKDV